MKKQVLVILALVASGGFLTSSMNAAEPTNPLRQLQDAFTSVAEEASKSVVVVNVQSKPVIMDSDLDEFGDPLEHFFGRKPRTKRSPPPKPQPQQGEGSGFIIRADGLILTNNHVVDGAEKIEVKLKDGKSYPAKVVGRDELTDVAVIKIEAKNLPVLKLGDSDKVRPGHWAIAIGAPFRLDYSITVGIISGKGRSAMTNTPTAYEDFLQTDASINPGNSGGPLLNIDGEVVGINTAIRGLNTGIGFAIPINLAKNIAEKLIAVGKVVRPWLGIEGASLHDQVELTNLIHEPKEGVVVRSVHPNTPADRAGLQPMDVITTVDGAAVGTIKELQLAILKHNLGEKVGLEFYRAGKKQTKELVLSERLDIATASNPSPPPVPSRVADESGVKVKEFSAADAEKFGVKGLQGVAVAEVEPNSPAVEAGLSVGDVITEMDHQPIRSPKDVEAALQKGDLKRGVEVQFTRAQTHVKTFGVLREP